MTDALSPDTHLSATPDLIQKIEAGGYWTVFASLNFEECSMQFVRHCLEALSENAISRVSFKLLRLESSHTSRWSVLESVKSGYENNIRELANSKNANLEVLAVEYPVGRDAITGIISDTSTREKLNLIVDISGFPREMAMLSLTILFGLGNPIRRLPQGLKFAVVTEPRNVVGRSALGPSSVGRPRLVFNDWSTMREVKRQGHTTALVFCGPEGFEARHAIDEIQANSTHVTAVFPLETASNRDLNPITSANQSLILERDALNLAIRYSMCDEDIVRISEAIVEDAIQRVRSTPNRVNALLVAPFGSKKHLVGAALCGALFARKCEAIGGVSSVFDAIVLNTSQYTSLHSHGYGKTTVFELNPGH